MIKIVNDKFYSQFRKSISFSFFPIRRFVPTAVFLLLSLAAFAQVPAKPYLVVLSMDGFRWDYPDSFPTPDLGRMAREGVKAKSLIPVFPTVTFPNHYTMATGLYPDHHGIIHNYFYAPEFDQYYSSNDEKAVSDGKFYNGEPIWITAEKQNVRTACFYWVGSEASFKGMRPSYWKKYDKNIAFSQQTDTVIHWLQLPEALRPHLIMLYFDQPDHQAHSSGPFSPEVKQWVMRLDSLVGNFRNRLSHLPIGNRINFMIVSDHGMEAVSDARKVILDKYIRKDWCERITGHYPLVMIDPKQNLTDTVWKSLSKAPHIQVWKKKDIPARLHFGANPRIGDLVVLADSSYSVIWSDEKVDLSGNHGYDNRNMDMHGIFYASGPAFKSGVVHPSFENTDIYDIIASVLKIKPAKNDGHPLKTLMK